MFQIGMPLLGILTFFCGCVIVYEFRTIVKDKNSPQKKERLKNEIKKEISRISLSIDQEKTIPLNTSKLLYRRLRRADYLISFNESVVELKEEGLFGFAGFVKWCEPVVYETIKFYSKKKGVYSAYLAYMISIYGYKTIRVKEVLLSIFRKNSLYCKVNALQAIAQLGDINFLIQVMKEFKNDEIDLEKRVLLNVLLSVDEDKEILARKLWDVFDDLKTSRKITIIQFFKHQKIREFCPNLLELLKDSETDKELQLTLIKFFTEIKYDPAEKELNKKLNNTKIDWEYQALAAKALKIYHGEESKKSLKNALRSQNWFVRNNSAESLIHLKVSEEFLNDIEKEKDVYAKEALDYARVKLMKLEIEG